jgi:hypothetical protein
MRPGRAIVNRPQPTDLVERAALGASLLCLLHCLALPLLIALLPALNSVLPTDTGFHIAMLAFAVPASGLALTSGQAQHGISWPLLVGLFGLFSLTVGVLAFGGSWLETAFTVTGALLLGIAHIANLRLRRACTAHRNARPILVEPNPPSASAEDRSAD